MEAIGLTKRQARRFLLAHQMLWPSYQLEGKKGIRDYIRHAGCVQFDPLNIVGNNPELVLQSRIANFRPALLKELLYTDRALLDGWDKNMSIYSVEDWPYFARYRDAARNDNGKSFEEVNAILPQVRTAVEKRGPLSSLDLDFSQTVDWAWAPTRLARAALESLYFRGELVIHHRVHTRRVYDFASRHLSKKILAAPEPNPTDAQYHDWYVLRRLGSVGLMWNKSGEAWLGMRHIKSNDRYAALQRLLKQGLVREARIEGITTPFYLKQHDFPALERVMTTTLPPPSAAILAPLDNLLWDRWLVESLFHFRYRWEVYKPIAEREYGYYVLPVLYGDRFVARFEPGRRKAGGALVIKNWWWEPNVKHSKRLHTALRKAFQRFLAYLGADCLEMDNLSATQKNLMWLAPFHT